MKKILISFLLILNMLNLSLITVAATDDPCYFSLETLTYNASVPSVTYTPVTCYLDSQFNLALADMYALSLTNPNVVIRSEASKSPLKIVAADRALAYNKEYQYNGDTRFSSTILGVFSNPLLRYPTDYLTYISQPGSTSGYSMYYFGTYSKVAPGTVLTPANLSVLIAINGAKGYVNLNSVDIIPLMYVENRVEVPFNLSGLADFPVLTYYSVTRVTKATQSSSVTYNEISVKVDIFTDAYTTTIGIAPDWLPVGKYYSWDGIVFYTDVDLKNPVMNGDAIGTFYNYYSFLNLRSKTNLTGAQLDAFLVYRLGSELSSSEIKDQGNVFIDAQNTYGMNALIIYAMAGIESGFGTSYFAGDRYNLFGWAAYDSNPDAATSYASVADCVNQQMGLNLRKSYMNYNSDIFYGSSIGNERSGFIRYASGPFWSTSIAGVAFQIDRYFGFKDYNQLQIGIINDSGNRTIYKDSSLTTALYTINARVTNYPVVIIDAQIIGDQTIYTVQSTNVINADGSVNTTTANVLAYDWAKSIGYISSNQISIYTNSFVRGVSNNAYYSSSRELIFPSASATLNGATIPSGYTVSDDGSYTLVVTNSSNQVQTIQFTIDKTAPVISGLDTNLYFETTPSITFNEGTAKLDNVAFTSGNSVITNGSHTLIVTDLAGNTSSKTFEVVTSDSIVENLQSDFASFNTIDLKWDTIPFAKSFIVSYAKASDEVYTSLDATTDTSIRIQNLEYNVLYNFKVQIIFDNNGADEAGINKALITATPLGAAPTNIVSLPETISSTHLSWDSVLDAEGYYVYKYNSSTLVYDLVADVVENEAIISGSTGIAYSIKIVAYKTIESSIVLGTDSQIQSITIVPPSPTTLTAVSSTYRNIKISWSAVTGTTGYEVAWATELNGTYTSLGYFTSTSIIDTGYRTGKVYYFRVRAYKTVGTTKVFGPYKSNVSGMALPGSPIISVLSGTYNSVTIKWPLVTNANGYSIYMQNLSTLEYELLANTSALSYAVSSLTAGQSRNIKVSSYVIYNSVKSMGLSSSVLSIKSIPATTSGLKASSNSYNSIRLTWTASGGASHYSILRSTSLYGTYTAIGTSLTNSFIDNNNNSGLSTNKTYYYKVRSYVVIGSVTTLSSAVSAAAYAKPIPNTVVASASTYSSTANRISWSPISGASGYQIYYATSKTGTYVFLKTIASSSVYTYVHFKITTNKTYYYKVRAYRLVGSTYVYGAFSSIVYNAPK